MMYKALVSLSAVAASVAVAADPVPTWTMKPVQSIQARVQAFPPSYDAGPGHNTFVADFVKDAVTFQDKYRVSMDTVNTASVEGALMYLQAEGIDYAVNKPCYRKNNMSYIWFYNITIVQPTYMLAEFQDTQMPEYGPFVAMDNGICTPISAAVPVPAECKEIDGLDNFPKLGPFVGGEPRKDDPRAPYDENIWFSYPNSCYLSPFGGKSEACRKTQTGGLCPRGTKPDGIKCTYAFEVIGFVAIDDLVGITSMPFGTSGRTYSGFVEFCKDNKVEFDSRNLTSMIPFWRDPFNRTANQARSTALINYYNQVAKQPNSYMQPLPTLKELTDNNPPCYLNSKKCYDAAFGCRRVLLAQVCQVCTTDGTGCVKKPANAEPFPDLPKAERKVPQELLVTNTTGAFGKNATPSPAAPGSPSSIAGKSSAAVGSNNGRWGLVVAMASVVAAMLV
ncbi:hypothetical protein AaE_007953 [Aphanomyces astaci]|uniref:Secreted protein n=5 Tax=Aphanomyces astaci TaxID=112090 RepID=A0A3R7AZG0_APHAT|nr:hypothetical protein AaE_007953 [Aphanomyces astaci]RHY69775.1 hypothetical protein DYB34_008982 [Aphanomyces astaci]